MEAPIFDNDDMMAKIVGLENISDADRQAINKEVLDTHDTIRKIIAMKMSQLREDGQPADRISGYLDVLTAGLISGASLVYTQQNKICHAWMFGRVLSMVTSGNFTLALIGCAVLPMRDGSEDPQLKERYGDTVSVAADTVNHVALEVEGNNIKVHLNENADKAVERIREVAGDEAVCESTMPSSTTSPAKGRTIH